MGHTSITRSQIAAPVLVYLIIYVCHGYLPARGIALFGAAHRSLVALCVAFNSRLCAAVQAVSGNLLVSTWAVLLGLFIVFTVSLWLANAVFHRRVGLIAQTLTIVIVIVIFNLLFHSCFPAIASAQCHDPNGLTATETADWYKQLWINSIDVICSKPEKLGVASKTVAFDFTRFWFDGLKTLLMLVCLGLYSLISRQAPSRFVGRWRKAVKPATFLGDIAIYSLLAGLTLCWFSLLTYINQGIPATPSQTWWYGFLLAFLPIQAFLEEVIFRSIVLGGLLQICPRAIAIILQALLFSQWHFHQTSLDSHVNLVVVGSLFGVVWCRYGIVGAFLVHCLGNEISTGLNWLLGFTVFVW
ncbi:MAG: CPBP family intramembrane glutamic endopeptidase [Candidatus Ozemobacteraceae bacterium]